MSEVIIYTLPTCSKCKTLKRLLTKKGWEYTEKEDIMHLYNDYPVVIIDGMQVKDINIFMKMLRA